MKIFFNAVTAVFLLAACSQNGADKPRLKSLIDFENQYHTDAETSSSDSEALVHSAPDFIGQVKAKAQVGILYRLDKPAHRSTVLRWLKQAQAEVTFESKKFGYIDADVDWNNLQQLFYQAKSLGLNNSTLLKLEVQKVEMTKASTTPLVNPDTIPQPTPPDGHSEFTGKVHSAGYGTYLEKFRKQLATEMGVSPEKIDGEGILVAVFDSGIDLARSDIFQNRMKDWVIGDESLWFTPTQSLTNWVKEKGINQWPKSIKGLQNNKSAVVFELKEELFAQDFNGSGHTKDIIHIVAYEENGKHYVRFSTDALGVFGDDLLDYGVAIKNSQPSSVNLATGKYYDTSKGIAEHVVGVKFRKNSNNQLQLALVGHYWGSHGIANLHMVGGRYQTADNGLSYNGVAPEVGFIGVQAWADNYGQGWTALAKTMIKATDAGADVLDLDIYVPGHRGGKDLLSSLACRIVALTDTVPVMAAHNFGPLPHTVQNFAQSPCILTIGASVTTASATDGYGVLPEAVSPETNKRPFGLQTFDYSGRGPSLNGLLKPDIISPAYGYTVVGQRFGRFGGTSGATPTTAGLISLLKQAARTQGVELGFAEVKYLLQSSSMDLGHDRSDGYGYTDIAAAWSLFKGMKTKGIAPHLFVSTGNPILPAKAGQVRFPISVARMGKESEFNAPIDVKVWLEIPDILEQSGYKLLIRDPESGALSKSVDWQSPFPPNANHIEVHQDLSPDALAKIPPGDYVILLKGLRNDEYQAGTRKVDFIRAFIFSKGLELGNNAASTFKLTDLFHAQHKTIALTSNPGDRFKVRVHTNCQGHGDNNELIMTMDMNGTYPHGSSIMNTYWGYVAQPGPYHLVSNTMLYRLAFVRSSARSCSGAMDAEVDIERLMIEPLLMNQKHSGDSTSTKTNSHFEINTQALGEWAGNGLVVDIDRNSAVLRMRRKITEANKEYCNTAPPGVEWLRATPQLGAEFVGALASGDKDALVIPVTVGRSGAYGGGFASLDGIVSENQKFDYYPTLLAKWGALGAGKTFCFFPGYLNLSDNNLLELQLKLSAINEVQLQSSLQWKRLNLNIDLQTTTALPLDSLKNYPLNEWDYEIIIPISIERINELGGIGIENMDHLVWQGELKVPLSF